jgi:hypothetical protein
MGAVTPEHVLVVLASRGPVKGGTLVCAGYDSKQGPVRVTKDGHLYSEWREHVIGGHKQLTIQSDIQNDTTFDLHFNVSL